MHKRREIDAAFAAMAADADYQEEAELIAEDFAQSDWEAFRLVEDDLDYPGGRPFYARSFSW